MKLPFVHTIHGGEMAPLRGLIIDRAPDYNGKRGNIVSLTLVFGIKAPWRRWFKVDYDTAISLAKPMAWVRFTYMPPFQFEWARGVMPVDSVRTVRVKRSYAEMTPAQRKLWLEQAIRQ